MTGVSASDLARELGVSRGRVSQYVSAGQLDGCYSGDGRARRFDLSLVASALGRRLDRGQMLGNGAATKAALQKISFENDAGDDGGADSPPVAPISYARGTGATELPPGDVSGYDMARTQIAMEDARRKRRDNLVAEGQYVLADEAARQVSRAIGQEIREFETVLRDGARRIADTLGVDFLQARQLLIGQFRAHRSSRAAILQDQAQSEPMTEAEQDADS